MRTEQTSHRPSKKMSGGGDLGESSTNRIPACGGGRKEGASQPPTFEIKVWVADPGEYPQIGFLHLEEERRRENICRRNSPLP